MAKLKLSSSLLWPLVILIIAFGVFYLKPWQAKTQVTPDIAKITATVESKNQNLDAARSQTEQKTAEIISKLKELGVGEKDIKTQNISAGPSYEIQIYPPQKPTTNQYSTSLEITVRDFKKADTVIATLTQNGASNLYGPNLTVSDEKAQEAKSKARENAVSEARNKGKELAKLSGRKLGKVTSIKEQGDFTLPPPIFAQGGIELQQKASQIQPGQNEVAITLQVDFSLK